MKHSLYRKILLDHYRNPRHSQLLTQLTHSADTANRSCGDRVQLTLNVDHQVIKEVGIVCEGCALATAGGSVLAEVLVGKSLSEAQHISSDTILELLGGITPSTSRMQCATLALHALSDALNHAQ